MWWGLDDSDRGHSSVESLRNCNIVAQCGWEEQSPLFVSGCCFILLLGGGARLVH